MRSRLSISDGVSEELRSEVTATIGSGIQGTSPVWFGERRGRDLESLMPWLDGHGLVSLTADLLSDDHASADRGHDGIPAGMEQHLQASMARSLLLSRELTRILGAFEEKGIRAIPWKGPALSHRLYGNAWSRDSGDLDIFVGVVSREEQAEILDEVGFGLCIDPNRDGGVPVEDEHCVVYQHETLPVVVEIHSKPFPTRYPFRFPFTELEKCATETIRIRDGEFPALDEGTELLLLAAHAAKHHWTRLGWLADLARLWEIGSDLDPQRLLMRARQTRSLVALLVSLELARRVFGIDMSRLPLDRVGTFRKARRLADKVEPDLLTASE
ncbi:MAG: nucleotidyltransferase family protein, partial [Verrucomicrobiota bacterium]